MKKEFKSVKLNKINELPKTAGVYCFWDKNQAIYIGKAISIRERVKNHFQQPSYRDNLFMNKVSRIGFYETGSEIEALILEASLIKKYQPKFNVVWRDDKNYFYVAIVPMASPSRIRDKIGKNNEQKIPYVYITHQPTHEIRSTKSEIRNKFKIQNSKFKIKFIGPFVEGTALKKTLRFLRKVFPYYTAKKHPKVKCMYCHLGLCPGPEPDLPEYKKNIKKLVLILEGKRGAVLRQLKKEMQKFSKEKEFENAGKIRDRILALEQIMLHTHVINGWQEFVSSRRAYKTAEVLQGIIGAEKPVNKIEAYDVSNIQGKQATGSMVVFVDGAPDKNLYRKFKIKMKNEPNDIAMLKETLTRRFSHPEWEFPDAILIDGGIAQLNAGISVKSTFVLSSPRKRGSRVGAYTLDSGHESGSGQAFTRQNDTKSVEEIKVLSLAKRNKELYIEGREKPVLLKFLPQEIYNLIIHLDDEAHRFAISYHKNLRKKALKLDF